MVRTSRHRHNELKSLTGSGSSRWGLNRDQNNWLNLATLKLVYVWMFGVAVLSLVQVTARLTIKPEIYIALIATALFLTTIASARQSGTISRDQEDGIEYSKPSKTIFRAGFFNYIWLNILLVGITFLYIYSDGYRAERIEKVKYESPRNSDQQLYILFQMLVIFGGVVNSGLLCVTKMANRIES